MKKKRIVSVLLSTFLITNVFIGSTKAYALSLDKDKIHSVIDTIGSGIGSLINNRDNNEENKHNTKNSAKEISLDNTEEFIATKKVRNIWTRFEIPSNGIAKVYLKVPLKGNGEECRVNLRLEDTSGSEVYLDTNNESVELEDGESYKKWVVGLKPGTYYMNLNCITPINQDIQVPIYYKVDYIKTDNFEKETNNSMEDANEVSLNEKYYGVINEDNRIVNNNDYYKFDLNDRGVCISFTKDNVDNNFIVMLIDYMGNSILPNKKEYNGKTTDYYFNGLEPGKFYLDIKGGLPRFTQGLYSFEIKNNRDGWIKENNNWYYYEDGEKKTGFVTIDRKKYYLDKDGARQTGWIDVYGKKYYANDEGVLKTGWTNLDGDHYYMDENGTVQTNWQKLNGLWYYFGDDGKMRTGWVFVGDSWYYLNDVGAMKTGWFNDNGTWYYLNDSGRMVTGWNKINYNWYYMNSSGAMATGWFSDGSYWYYLGTSGAMQTGWIQQDNTWYYLNSSGVMLTGWNKINGSWYYLYNNGAMAKGWIAYDGHWYYLYESGSMATNTTIDGWNIDSNGVATN